MTKLLIKRYEISKVTTHSLTHSSTHSLTHSLTHLLTYSLTHSLTHSLTQRLDMCCSQILGYVVTHIRTVLALASTHRGPFLEVLSRSLRIGFLANLNSMLTTDGKEKGYSLTHLTIYSLTHSLTHSLTQDARGHGDRHFVAAAADGPPGFAG